MTYLTRVHSPFDRDHFDVIVFCCCFSARIDQRARLYPIVPSPFICATEEVHPTNTIRVNTR